MKRLNKELKEIGQKYKDTSKELRITLEKYKGIKV